MEWAAVNACGTHSANFVPVSPLAEPILPKGFATVGYHVDVKVGSRSSVTFAVVPDAKLTSWQHLAPTPLGKEVVAKAELLEITDKKLTFKVDAFEVR